jgi:phosphatidylglycerol:prolipoprotein diacylglycerol transferase
MIPTILPIWAFPMIDPVAIQIGPLGIRWYALAYIAGLLTHQPGITAIANPTDNS